MFKCGRKLKDTNVKMFEDIPKELHDKARKDGKLAYFSKSEPYKLFIDGKYVQF